MIPRTFVYITLKRNWKVGWSCVQIFITQIFSKVLQVPQWCLMTYFSYQETQCYNAAGFCICFKLTWVSQTPFSVKENYANALKSAYCWTSCKASCIYKLSILRIRLVLLLYIFSCADVFRHLVSQWDPKGPIFHTMKLTDKRYSWFLYTINLRYFV